MDSGKKHIAFIINPISGVGKKNLIPPLIKDHLDHQKFTSEIIYTKYRGHAREIAAELKSSADAIIAVGGDGSVNETGSSLIHSKCALGIVPCGSGNGLARHLKIPLNLKRAIKQINEFKVHTIDTGKVNDHIFLGTCGFGFDAHIAKKFDEYHKRGFSSYIKLVIREFNQYREKSFTLKLDGDQITKNALMCSIANSSQFGNGFTISPLSNSSDGQFELILLRKFPWYRSAGLARRFFSNSVHRSSYFESKTFQHELILESVDNETLPLHIDGDPAGNYAQFRVEVLPQSLQILI